MPRKPAKKRDFMKSSGGKTSIYRIRHIHDCIKNEFTDAAGDRRRHNTRDIQNYLHHTAVPSVIVSIKTVRRDIEFMRDDLNMPIDFDRKMNGWWYTKPTDTLPLINATEGDLFGFMLFQQTLRHYQGTPLYNQLSNTMDKITNQLSDELSVSLEDISKSVAYRDTKIPLLEMKNLQAISNAVTQSQQLKLNYRRPNKEPEERVVDPYQCANVNGTWYLFGYDHLRKDVRCFKVVRIEQGSERTGKTFKRPDDFNLDDHIDWGVIRGTKEYDIVVDFIPEVANILREKQFHHSQVITEKKKGGVRVSYRLTDYREFRSWILSFGAAAKVKLPEALRDSIHNIGKKIAENHKPKKP